MASHLKKTDDRAGVRVLSDAELAHVAGGRRPPLRFRPEPRFPPPPPPSSGMLNTQHFHERPNP